MFAHGPTGFLGPMRKDRVDDFAVALRALDGDGFDFVGAVPLAVIAMVTAAISPSGDSA